MQPKELAIRMDNSFDIVAVWENDSKRWHLLRLTRPNRAIALYWKNPETRLIFPVDLNPNHVGKETLGRKKRKYERSKQQSFARSYSPEISRS